MTGSVSRKELRAAILLWRPIRPTKVLTPGTIGHALMGYIHEKWQQIGPNRLLKRDSKRELGSKPITLVEASGPQKFAETAANRDACRTLSDELEIPNRCSCAIDRENAAAEDGGDACRFAVAGMLEPPWNCD